jgi:hypothetical protein
MNINNERDMNALNPVNESYFAIGLLLLQFRDTREESSEAHSVRMAMPAKAVPSCQQGPRRADKNFSTLRVYNRRT